MSNIKNIKFSPLMDPLLLADPVINQKAGAIWDKLGKVNWYNVLVNWLAPFLAFLFVAFYLRSRYDQKRQLYDDYLVDYGDDTDEDV